MGKERTWEKKGSKDIKVTGMEDKRQVTCCVSSSSDGTLLPMQIIFTGKTKRCLPKTHVAKLCLADGFHMTMSSNHWSNLETCQQFVRHILVPYFQCIVKELQLPSNQKMIWLLDCWSVHKSEAFLTWMKKEHPRICVLFIPANCTSKLQPADVILQRPLKCAFSRCFKQWSAACIQEQLEGDVSRVQLDLRIGTLREELCTWLLQAWKEVGSRTDMIIKGWEKCGLLRPFDKIFQAEAMECNSHNSLFSDVNVDEEHEESLDDIDEWEELFEDEDIMDLMARCVVSDEV
jgi:hypothetical protein